MPKYSGKRVMKEEKNLRGNKVKNANMIKVIGIECKYSKNCIIDVFLA